MTFDYFKSSYFINFMNCSVDRNTLIGIINTTKNYPPVYDSTNAIIAHLEHAVYDDFKFITDFPLHHIKSNKEFRLISYVSDELEESARCSQEEGVFFVTVSYRLLCKLVLLAQKLAPLIKTFEAPEPDSRYPISHDEELLQLINGTGSIDIELARETAFSWFNESYHRGFGPQVIFYDLVRLVFLHEWSHCILGHIEQVNRELGLSSLKEHDVNPTKEYKGYSRPNMLLQAIEMEADRVAISTLTVQLMIGIDASIALFGEDDINLGDRLSVVVLAIAAYSAVWHVKEKKEGFPDHLATIDVDMIIDSSHPPAIFRFKSMFRYLCVNITNLSMERGISISAAKHFSNPDLNLDDARQALLIQSTMGQSLLEHIVRMSSHEYMQDLIELCHYFGGYLRGFAPVKFVPRLQNYEKSYSRILYEDLKKVKAETCNCAYVVRTLKKGVLHQKYYPHLLFFLEPNEEVTEGKIFPGG